MTPDDTRHGTPRGYSVHRGDHEDACTRCLRAAARYEQERQLAILAGRPLLVDKTSSIRRLRALQAIGWSSRTLSLMLGRRSRYLDVLATRANHATIRAGLAEEIADLYQRLHMTPGPSTVTRSRALAKGWAPPLAWDDIDNDPAPNTTPTAEHDDLDHVAVARILGGDPTPARGATLTERRETARRWLEAGRPLRQLGELTGWKAERYLPQPTPDEKGHAA